MTWAPRRVTTPWRESLASISTGFGSGSPSSKYRRASSVFENLARPRGSRGNFNVDFYWKLVNDFYWEFSIYYTYYGNASPTASTTDYGVTASR
jgi:hypothetical protein